MADMLDLDPKRLAATMRQLAREEFSIFIEGAFRILHDEPFLRTWHIDAIAHQLSCVERGDVKRLLITMPPRTMKSFIASVCLPAWLLGRNPAEKIICASYAHDLSKEFSYQTRKLMQSEWYRKLFPDTRLDPKKNSTDELGTTKGGSRLSTSVGGTLTGRGGNYIIIDDPIKAKDAYSETVREGAIDWFKGTVQSRLNNPKTGRIIVVAQRLHMEDLPGYLIGQGGWTELCLPLVNDRDQVIFLTADVEAERPAGNILHEARFDDAVITSLRKELGEQQFEAQYNQRPLPPGGALFKLSWLKRYEARPKPSKVQGVVQSWDTAYEIEDHNDYSVDLGGVGGKLLST
ncbi:terminase large subunit domain-containing protein [Asticcacaulis tiandongensis]|uniref:terminase large subunit domain-containing protein n=1 Tax=Asticcacaulis tiandongensis TaxID=2565365 RepID=UPI0011278C99|nr:terminase family protein [Asticcacaulis tiandongensis]